MSSLKICFVASEAVPFFKTGGLADVAAALPAQLARLGHDVRPFLPLHSTIDSAGSEFHRVDFLQDVPIQLGPREFRFSVWTSEAGPTAPPFYFIDCPELFHRPQLYTSDADEPLRFGLYSRAVLESCQRMGWAPDLMHCNDWHTGLIPLLIKSVYEWDALFAQTRSLLTIHNLGYQGVFPGRNIAELGLTDWTHMLDPRDVEADRINLLRTGLIYADAITTVSPTYAAEIQTADYGMGLQDLLRARNSRLVGILNGVDYDEWSPEKDRHIPHRFSRKRRDGKRANKKYLMERLGIGGGASVPLLGIVSRMTRQKGFDLCFAVLPEILETTDLRIVVLGTGDRKYEEFFEWLQGRFTGRVTYYRGYNDELAHLIEAGSDMFLMPSLYEPCGLNQMFSLRYGTVPIVRKTGGLADSVESFDPRDGTGTGIVFENFDADGLRWALRRAVGLYRDAAAWDRLVTNAMEQDFSWSRQAERYLELYSWLVRENRT